MSIEEGSITGSSAGVAPTAPGTLESRGRDLGRKADEVGARLSSGLRDKAHEIGSAGRHLQEKAVAAKDKVAHGVHDGRDRVEHEMQEHPMRTLLWAFGAGALVGLMLGRRSRR